MLQVRLCRDATTPTAGNLPSTPIWIPVSPYFLREHMGCRRAAHARCRTRITAETQENSQLCESTTFLPAGLLLHFLRNFPTLLFQSCHLPVGAHTPSNFHQPIAFLLFFPFTLQVIIYSISHCCSAPRAPSWMHPDFNTTSMS